MLKAPNVKWTREHFLIALNLYHKLEFGKLHKGNPLIIEVAEKMAAKVFGGEAEAVAQAVSGALL